MNNFFKLSTVSILALMAASNANAAGYTCEELIEYTSCNDGYYLNAGDCIEGATCAAGNYLLRYCDDEYQFQELVFNACVDTGVGVFEEYVSKEFCDEICDGSDCYYYAGWHCLDMADPHITHSPTVECVSCPTVAMKDKDGNAVTVKSEPGSFGVNSCYIDPNAYFTDTKGTYHYTSNCSAIQYDIEIDQSICKALGGVDGECFLPDSIPLSQSECEKMEEDGAVWKSETGMCYCESYWTSEPGESLKCNGLEE